MLILGVIHLEKACNLNLGTTVMNFPGKRSLGYLLIQCVEYQTGKICSKIIYHPVFSNLYKSCVLGRHYLLTHKLYILYHELSSDL